MFYLALFILVEDMIKEVDVDGDGRIDFYGKYTYLLRMYNIIFILLRTVPELTIILLYITNGFSQSHFISVPMIE